jgi:hypothetical protein
MADGSPDSAWKRLGFSDGCYLVHQPMLAVLHWSSHESNLSRTLVRSTNQADETAGHSSGGFRNEPHERSTVGAMDHTRHDVDESEKVAVNCRSAVLCHSEFSHTARLKKLEVFGYSN